MVVDDFGVVDATIGDGVEAQIGLYREAIKELA
jgi:hypothetical protein